MRVAWICSPLWSLPSSTNPYGIFCGGIQAWDPSWRTLTQSNASTVPGADRRACCHSGRSQVGRQKLVGVEGDDHARAWKLASGRDQDLLPVALVVSIGVVREHPDLVELPGDRDGLIRRPLIGHDHVVGPQLGGAQEPLHDPRFVTRGRDADDRRPVGAGIGGHARNRLGLRPGTATRSAQA